MDWRERIRNLWVERVVWIRHYIISLVLGLRDLSFVATRLLRNGAEIARLVARIYGVEVASQFETVLTQNILLLSELASTAKADGDISPMRANWDANANALLESFLTANPNWDRALWQEIIEDQYQLELDLVHSLRENRYEEGINNFDLAYDNALRIARYMIEGIEQQSQNAGV